MDNKQNYILRAMVHPIDSFWEMKNRNTLKSWIPPLLIFAYFLVTLFDRQVRAFSFNDAYNTPLNIMYQIRIVIIPIALFCLSNWAVTTLLDGKGNIKDIFMVTAYSLVPLCIFKVISALMSLVFSLNESVYLNIIDWTGIVWFGIILFVGIMAVHEYSFKKMIITLILTAIAAAIIIFVVLLFFSLFSEILGFIYSVYRELTLRI